MPLRFIVPFGRGGASDRAARAYALSLGRGSPKPGTDPKPENRGPSLENIPGGGGLLGVRRANELARSGEPVLLLGTPTTHVLLPARLGEEEAPDASLRPVAGLGSAPNVLLVSPALGVSSVEQLVAKARTVTLVYASAGTGQTIHVCTALFCAQAGVRMIHRPYDSGSATAYGDVAAGRVQVYFDSLLGCRERVARGDAVALAVSSRRRSVALPQVPTLAECGFPDHAMDVWLGVFACGWNSAAAADDHALAPQLAALGLSGGPTSAAALAAEVAESAPRWRRALEIALRGNDRQLERRD